MKFGDALSTTLESGIGIYRPSWNGNAHREQQGVMQWVAPYMPSRDGWQGLSEPFLVIHQKNRGVTPWVPSQGDLFADDWTTL